MQGTVNIKWPLLVTKAILCII